MSSQPAASLASYTPPLDFVEKSGPIATAFSHDRLADKELWLLRIPDNVSARDLDGLTIKNPFSAPNGVALSETKIDGTPYQIVTPKASGICAEFKGMAELSLLMPDEDDDGKLALVPNRCTQLMALVEKIDIPDSYELAKRIAVREKPAREQPENMQMKFIPYGFYSAEEYQKQYNGGVITPAAPSMPASVASTEPEPKKRKTATSDEDVEMVEPKEKIKKEKKDKKDN
ncbi:hypothetical protein GGI07_002291 [Coemansia sp. Benny D115]|nr:hypothetical protein GGI07_002291 [Coemansia sp. Benny D115]